MAVTQRNSADRRKATSPKLVVVDLASVFPDWIGPVPPHELIVRSVVVRTLAEARRDNDVYLIGSSLEMAWAASEVFPGAAVFIEPDDPDEEKELSGQFLEEQKTGIFGELVIVSGDRRFLEVAELFRSTGRTVRVLTSETACDIVLNGESDLTLYLPNFDDVEG